MGWNTGPTVSYGQLIRTHNESIYNSDYIGFGILMTKENVDHKTTRTKTRTKTNTNQRHQNNDHSNTTATTNKQFYWIMGKYRDFTMNNNNNNLTTNNNLSGRIQHFCTGFGWLVYDGNNVANNNHNPTGADRAPRTAIGIDHNSNLMLVVVDGCEKW